MHAFLPLLPTVLGSTRTVPFDDEHMLRNFALTPSRNVPSQSVYLTPVFYSTNNSSPENSNTREFVHFHAPEFRIPHAPELCGNRAPRSPKSYDSATHFTTPDPEVCNTPVLNFHALRHQISAFDELYLDYFLEFFCLKSCAIDFPQYLGPRAVVILAVVYDSF